MQLIFGEKLKWHVICSKQHVAMPYNKCSSPILHVSTTHLYIINCVCATSSRAFDLKFFMQKLSNFQQALKWLSFSKAFSENSNPSKKFIFFSALKSLLSEKQELVLLENKIDGDTIVTHKIILEFSDQNKLESHLNQFNGVNCNEICANSLDRSVCNQSKRQSVVMEIEIGKLVYSLENCVWRFLYSCKSNGISYI